MAAVKPTKSLILILALLALPLQGMAQWLPCSAACDHGSAPMSMDQADAPCHHQGTDQDTQEGCHDGSVCHCNHCGSIPVLAVLSSAPITHQGEAPRPAFLDNLIPSQFDTPFRPPRLI